MGKPQVTLMTDEDLLVHPEMIDEDNVEGFEGRFRQNACMTDGCSGKQTIDTLYENTSQDTVENPREKTTEAPVCMNPGMYPHRSL
ncbi:MAG: hypothetical protein ACYTFQ_26005 [Planctomycetota bacterium]|jgi:hypothetical protein